MADAKMQVMKTTSKGTMPVVDYNMTAYKAVPQNDKPTDKSFWDAGNTDVPAHAKPVPNNDSEVHIDKSLDRMAAEHKVYQTF